MNQILIKINCCLLLFNWGHFYRFNFQLKIIIDEKNLNNLRVIIADLLNNSQFIDK